MTHIQLLEAFIDQMQSEGKINEDDFNRFIAMVKHNTEAKKIVNDMFKQAGMS